MTPFPIPPEEFAARRASAARAAAGAGLTGLLACARGGGTLDRYGDVVYLANHYTSFPYIPDLEGAWSGRAHAFVLVASDGDSLLVTDAPDDGRTAMPAEAVIVTGQVLDGVAEAMERLGMGRGPVGIAGTDVMPVRTFWALSERLPGAGWRDAGEILARLRAIKSPAEIAALRRASEIGSRAIEAMMEAAVPGASHGDVVAAGMAVLAPAGAALYNSFMASGRGGEEGFAIRRNFPTWGSDEKLEEGQWFRVGLSGVLDGYFFDLSCSRAVGPPSNRMVELFEHAVEIVEAGIGAIRPGATAREVAEAGLSRQEALGYPNDGVFSGLGHGVGLGWDAPWLAPGDETVLEPGMVLCVERTIRKDGYLGDFEETVVVTEDGCEKITPARIRWW